MLSIIECFQGLIALQESGGVPIAYDAKSKLLIFVSPDPKRFGAGLSSPETANEYFKVLNGTNYNKSNVISRVGFRNPQYEIHKTNGMDSVFLKPQTVQNLTSLLSQPYVIPNKPQEKRDWGNWLAEKNKQITQFNTQSGQNIPLLNNFNNWQAAIIWTNRINGLDPIHTIANDSRILGKDGLNKQYLPFDLEMPDYISGLPVSEQERRKVKEYKRLKRY